MCGDVATDVATSSGYEYPIIHIVLINPIMLRIVYVIINNIDQAFDLIQDEIDKLTLPTNHNTKTYFSGTTAGKKLISIAALMLLTTPSNSRLKRTRLVFQSDFHCLSI